MTVYVEDRFTIADARRVEVTPEGFLRLPANIARTGVQTYRTSDGKTFNVLRHPDDVFDTESLASWGGKPVTIGHPAEPVTVDRFKDLAVGLTDLQVHGDRRVADVQERQVGYVRTVVQVTAADGVRAVRDEGRTELSCGYSCDWVPTEGTWDGVPYQMRQQNIRGNHVALLRPGEGRAGPAVRLYGLDSAAVQVDAAPQEVPPMAEQQVPASLIQITRDGVSVPVTADAATLITSWVQAADARAQDMASEMEAMKAKLEKMTGERDALKAELDKMKMPAKDQADLDKQARDAVAAQVARRVQLLADAERLTRGTQAKFTADMGDRAIMEAVILARQPEREISKDRSDAYVEGLYEGISGSVAADAVPPTTPPAPPAVEGDKQLQDSRAKMIADMGKPLT